MNRALLKVEFARRRVLLVAALTLGGVGPWFVALALGGLGEPVEAPIADYLLSASLTRPVVWDLLLLATFVLALGASAQAFPAQRDAGTDRFLATLPLTARTVFAARALSCAAVVLAAVVARHAAYATWHLLFGECPPGFLSEVVAPLFAWEVFASAVFVGLSLALAHWRRLGVLLVGAVVLALRLSTAHDVLPPGCDPLRFAAPRVVGAALAGPSLACAAGWTAGAAFATWWSYTLFCDRRDPLGRLNLSLRRGVLVPRAGAAAFALLSAAVPAALLAPEVRLGPPLIRYPARSVSVGTQHFRFSLSAREAGDVRALVDSADSIHERVAAVLGVSAGESGRQELVLSPELLGRDPAWHGYVLARLSAERLIRERTQGRLEAWGAAGRVLSAGLRRNVALVVSAQDPFTSRFHAAVLHSRRPFQLEDVFDSRELVAERGPEAVEALGEVFVAALRGVHGDAVLARLLAAVAESPQRGASRTLEASRALWEQVTTVAAINRVKVEERLLELLEDTPHGDARARVALPRLSVILEGQERPPGRRILAIPDQDMPAGWFVVCRVRRGKPGTQPRAPLRAQRLGPDAGGCEVFFVRSSPFEEPPWVQLGLRAVNALPTLDTIWERWTAPNGTP